METQVPKDYRYLIVEGHYSEEEIISRFQEWLIRIDTVLNTMELSEKTRIDCTLLSYALLDYFVDTLRIKEFHGMARTKVDKIYSYGLYWLLRKKPIQLLEDVSDNFLYINEKVFTICTLTMALEELGVDIDKEIEKKVFNEYVKLFYYNLKYRTFTPKTIELALESICFAFKGINKKC